MHNKSPDIVDLIYWAHALSPILGFIAYFIVVENVPKQNHLIFIYLVFCCFGDVLTFLQFIPGPIVFNIHDICQFIVIVTIYINLFKQRGVFYLATTILLYLIGITVTLTKVGIGVYHNHMWALSGFLISILCLVYVNAVNIWPKDLASDKDLYNTLMMNTSFLFYFMTTFLLFIMSKWMFTELAPEKLRVTWAFHNAIGLIKNIGLATAIFLTGKAKVNETIPVSPAANTKSIRL